MDRVRTHTPHFIRHPGLIAYVTTRWPQGSRNGPAAEPLARDHAAGPVARRSTAGLRITEVRRHGAWREITATPAVSADCSRRAR